MKNELVDEALSMIRTAGYEPSIVRGRHLKIFWVDHLGRHAVPGGLLHAGAIGARACGRAPCCADY